MTSYTVYNDDNTNEVYGRGLTAEQAMEEILTYDGYRYRIERSNICWVLYHSDGSENSPRSGRHMIKTVVCSFEETESAARSDIAQQVINAVWRRGPSCSTDEDYDKMLREASE